MLDYPLFMLDAVILSNKVNKAKQNYTKKSKTKTKKKLLTLEDELRGRIYDIGYLKNNIDLI